MFRDSQRLFAFRQEEANLIADICGAQAGGQQPNLFEVVFFHITREAMIISVPMKRARSPAVTSAMILAQVWGVATHPWYRLTRVLVGRRKDVKQTCSLIVSVCSPNLTRFRGLWGVLEITVERSALLVKPAPRRR